MQSPVIDVGKGEVVVLLHGLFGSLSNWDYLIEALASKYRVVVPKIPIAEVCAIEPSLRALTDYVESIIAALGVKEVRLIGNSLGGHIALLIALEQPHIVRSLVLTGSSGLFEESMGLGYPKRGDKAFIKERIGYTFYSESQVTDELFNDVFTAINHPDSALRILKIARDAQRMNLKDKLQFIQIPTTLIWGLNDNITPISVAYEFKRGIPNSTLYFIDECGHAPMMEQQETFVNIIQTIEL
jgi:pimeloyl-ACP methyl ester carboxylesterase